jgi:two-component system response regulator NreC
MRIAIADDHKLIRDGLRSLLATEWDLNVVGEASDGLQVENLVDNCRPDILLLDVMMPGLNGLEVTRQLIKRFSGLRIIILSMYANEGFVLQALKFGAMGYVLKNSGSTELKRAIRSVAAGKRYLSPPLSDLAIEAYIEKVRSTGMNEIEVLTERERTVLQMAAEGLSSNLIAEKLSISPRTVESHRANIMRKLHLQSHTDLIRFALRHGIIPLD